jgi:hypothetical protein
VWRIFCKYNGAQDRTNGAFVCEHRFKKTSPKTNPSSIKSTAELALGSPQLECTWDFFVCFAGMTRGE